MPSSPQSRPLLADLAQESRVYDEHASIPEIEAVLLADRQAPGVLAAVDGTVRLIDRPLLDGVLTGRLGFGRALMHRQSLRTIVPGPALVLPAAMTWDDAARAALARPSGSRDVPVVVDLGAGRYGIAPVAPLVDYLSVRYTAMALRDDLTGLGNRRMLAERAAVAGPDAVLMVIDLNRFKEINDTLGHSRGDELINHVAGALKRACPPDTAYRLGGDEFVIYRDDLLGSGEDRPGSEGTGSEEGTGSGEGLKERLEVEGGRLLDAIRGPFAVAGVPITVEASLGIAHTGPGGADGLDMLLAAADAAMYTAKRDRTRVELWHPDLASRTDLGLQSELRTAIGQGQLVLHYQPLVDAVTRRIVSVEALVRWAHPDRGLLPPGVFVPHAEASDVIHLLTERVLADAVAQAARWHADGWVVPVAVNLAAPVLASDRFVEVIGTLLKESGLPPSSLIVEVTESAVMTRPEQSAARLRTIRDLGVRVAVDDFGTGYTSLALLSRLPLDELKLDRSFVMRVHHPQEAVIVQAVTQMARGLGLTCVAEGVEDEATAVTLTKIGVDVLQGYHFSRPVPAEKLTAQIPAAA